MKKALISGITGQDGSYLAEHLLENGYVVYGLMRRVSLQEQEHRLWRLRNILDKINIRQATLESYSSIYSAVNEILPDECYHLASQSMVMTSFEDEFSTMNTNINGTHFLLSAIKHLCPACKMYFAGSSEMYGAVLETPQNEKTPFNPLSPYAVSKVAGFHLTKFYRDRHGLFALSGILFNHESPRRSTEFVTRKITKTVARINFDKSQKLVLGNIEAKRDWGYSPDYVKAMHLMLQQDKPEDYCICTGETHTVQEFVESAFAYIGIKDWKLYTVFDDERLTRPSEVDILLGSSNKAKLKLGWSPTVRFNELVEIMMKADLKDAELQYSR